MDNPNAILSREELAALLESIAEGQRQEHARQTVRPVGLEEPTGPRAELLRIAGDFAEEQGRSLSTLHQTSLSFALAHWEEITLREFASGMLDSDRVARVDLGLRAGEAYLLLNRPLVFGWMMLAFGARPGPGGDVIPARPYTRIEERFLRRAASEISFTLGKAVGVPSPAEVGVRSLELPQRLFEHGRAPYLVLSFDVQGLGEFCRLRVALPASLVERVGGESEVADPVQPSGVSGFVLDMSVQLRVGVGYAELTLSEVADLQPGDLLPLESLDADGLIVHVEEKPKFRAERGAIGSRLAVRIKEVL